MVKSALQVPHTPLSSHTSSVRVFGYTNTHFSDAILLVNQLFYIWKRLSDSTNRKSRAACWGMCMCVCMSVCVCGCNVFEIKPKKG